jgi:hypothetical protein
MTLEMLFGVVMIIAIALGVASRLIPKARPAETHFRCAHCNSRSAHTERTIEAWRNKKNKFYCQSCHQHWLVSQPLGARSHHSGSMRSGRAGCLGVLAAIAVLPVAIVAVALMLM